MLLPGIPVRSVVWIRFSVSDRVTEGRRLEFFEMVEKSFPQMSYMVIRGLLRVKSNTLVSDGGGGGGVPAVWGMTKSGVECQ